jgi:hypothetical protein
MALLFDADSGDHIGEISSSQLDFLISQMEEEHPDDQDYYLNADLLETWREQGADPALIDVLSKSMVGRVEMSIRWSK